MKKKVYLLYRVYKDLPRLFNKELICVYGDKKRAKNHLELAFNMIGEENETYRLETEELQ